MNFIKAVQHATICYGIRRKVWTPKAILSLGNGGEFYWLDVPEGSRISIDYSVKLLGPDQSFDLQPHDITAEDWEIV